jgi:hypothetical protein
MEIFHALGGSEPAAKKRTDACAAVWLQITKRQIQSVDFVQSFRLKRSPYGTRRLQCDWRSSAISRSQDITLSSFNTRAAHERRRESGKRTAVTVDHLPRS